MWSDMRWILALVVAVASMGCAAAPDEEAASSEDALAETKPCSVLVAMSDSDKLTAVSDSLLTKGQTKEYRFGYLLDEMAIPVNALLDAGCKVTFTDPSGVEPPRDKQGDTAFYFTDGLPEGLLPGAQARAELARALTLVDAPESPVRGKGLGSFDTPIPYDHLVKDGVADATALAGYDAIFIPGGYSGMNHWNDAKLGAILRWFHRNDRLTVTLCRGGVSLRSTTADGGAFEYAGYNMTTYATIEDDLASKTNGIKPLWDLPFHPNEKLKEVGANVTFRPFKPNVVEDRDLLSGENQFSAHALGKRMVERLTSR